MIRILLVEDEENVRMPLEDYLKREGFALRIAGTLAQAEREFAREAPELVLLDWMLPDGQGIELLRKWRSQGSRVPAILLTARAELVDKVVGLELGANDYVTKPFEPRELVARIRVQLRDRMDSGASGKRGEPVVVAGFHLDPRTRQVLFQGQETELTRMEFELLRVFLEHPNEIFSREELLKKVWGYERSPTTRTVDTHVLQLRQKFGAEPFETLHGIGYRFRFHK
ncbi:MAG: response regulator transcription factor [Oligoflexia bacterium]|nr:response regulator transcription factor [Oligoflexia bacterium]